MFKKKFISSFIFLSLTFTLSSSLKAQCITAYQHEFYKGTSWKFCANKKQPHRIRWNNRISSIKVPEGVKVKVCKNKNAICRSYFKSVNRVGFFDNRISHVQVTPFDKHNFTMIFSSDPQLPWACSTKECQALAKNEKDQGILSSKWQAQSMINLANTIPPHKFAGVVINGDLTAFGHPWQVRLYVNDYEKNFPLMVWPGLGNHDYANNIDDCFNNQCASKMLFYMSDRVNGLNVEGFDLDDSKAYYKFPVIRKQHTGSWSYSFEIGDFHFVQLHNYPTYETKFKGWNFGKARRDYFTVRSSLPWLKKDLAKATAKGKKIILNMHDTRQHFKSADRKKFYNILKGHKVIGIFAGHIHQQCGKIGTMNGISIFRSGAAEYNTYLKVDFKKGQLNVQCVSGVEGSVKNIKKNFIQKF